MTNSSRDESEAVRWSTAIAGAVLLLILGPGWAAPAGAETGVAGFDADAGSMDGGDAVDTAGAPDTVGDAGDTAIDAADTGVDTADAADTGVDTAMDAADTGVDTAADAADVDAGETGIDDADAGDTGADTGDTGDTGPVDVDAGPTFRFTGVVDVQFRNDESGVAVVLRRTDGDGRWERTTDPSGRFEFRGLAPGDYEVELSLMGYVSIGESFELVRDRAVRYSLFQDQDAALRVQALFPQKAEPPQSVDFELGGERGRRTPEESIAVEEGRAVWSVETLPVGIWRVEAAAEGWQAVSFDFAVREPRASTPYDVRLYMRQPPGTPPAADTSGCTCRDRGGGRAPGPGGPYAPPAALIAFGFGVLGLRLSRRF